MARMVVIYKTPMDAVAFAMIASEIQIRKARTKKGRISKTWP